MNWSVETMLTIHAVVCMLILIVLAWVMVRRHLFRWTSAGFWAWISFALYYVFNPMSALWQKDLYIYHVNITMAGGSERALRILSVTVVGILAFYIVYLRTPPVKVTWNISGRELTLPMVIFLIPFMAFGVYSLLTFRTTSIVSGAEMIISEGRFTGQISGYANIGYMFLFAPILLLLLSDAPFTRLAGWISAGVFFFLALPNGWSRYALVSLLLAISIADTLRRKRVLPRLWMMPIILILTIALQQRGHEQWTLSTAGNELLNLTASSVANVGKAVGSQDTSMLANWYLESYVKDTLTGYDYGLPLVNYIMLGWLPNRIVPQKYFLVDWLHKQQPVIPMDINNALYGTKSSLLGSFYGEGGIIAVIILSSLAGFLSRRLDGMVTPEAPLLVQSTGVAWMSMLWIVWGSSDSWSVMTLGVLVIPILVVWLFATKRSSTGHPTIPSNFAP